MKKSIAAVVVLILYCGTSLAGEYLVNDTGGTVYGLRVGFSEPVTITSFGDILTVIDPAGESPQFTFSGGALESWGGHWLNWKPASAVVLSAEWISEIPMSLADLAVVSHSEIATAFEVELAPSPIAFALRQVLIDDFESLALESRFGGSYGWDARGASTCEISRIPDGVSGGHVLFEYVNRSWLKVGLWGFEEPLDASGFEGIEVTLWSDEPVEVDAEIGAWNEANKWIAYVSEGLRVDRVPRTFRVPFDSFSPYNSSSTGIPPTHLARLNALSFFLRNDEGKLYLDNLGLYSEDPAPQELSSVSGETLKGTITRYVSSERIPFLVRYECDFPGTADLSFQWTVESGKKERCELTHADVLTAQNKNPTFLLMSNAESADIRLVIGNAKGFRYEWQDPAVDIPLHNLTEIMLDATQFVPEAEIESVLWTAENGDPEDAITFPISDPSSPITSLVSEWPNVLSVSCVLQMHDGSIIEKHLEALIYFRDGPPFALRGVAAHLDDIPEAHQEEIQEAMLSVLERVGVNLVYDHIVWSYGYPDEQGNFRIHPVYTPPKSPLGGTVPEHQWAHFADVIEEAGLDLLVLFDAYPYLNDPTLQQAFHRSGFAEGNEGFTSTEGFLYGDGEGYANMLLHFTPIMVERGVDIVLLDSESGWIEKYGGDVITTFFSDMISEFRQAGFTGALSYAPACFFNGDWPTMPLMPFENLDPALSSIPYSEMDYVSVTFYPALATSNDAPTDEMYRKALDIFDQYLRPFSEAHGKPLLIAEMYTHAFDGCAVWPMDPEGADKPYDPEEQRRWFTAMYRAISTVNSRAITPWIAGVVSAEYFLFPDEAFTSMRANGERAFLRYPLLNDASGNPLLQKLVRAYYSYIPLRVE